jgi:hypothetical protein
VLNPTIFGLRIVAILLLAGSHVAAQQTPAADTKVATTTIPAGQLFSVFGAHVLDSTGADAGRLWDILADKAGKPQVAIIDYGGALGIGERKVAVAWQAIQIVPTDTGHPVHLALTRQQLGEIPEFKYDSGPITVGGGQ